MNKLLASDCFQSFVMKEASILGQIQFQMDGKVNRDFFAGEEADILQTKTEEYINWEEIRSICFDIIKGKRTPTRFHFVLYLKTPLAQRLLSKQELTMESACVQNFVLNIRFDQGKIVLTTAVDYAAFTMDKQAEQLWDKALQSFLLQKQITWRQE